MAIRVKYKIYGQFFFLQGPTFQNHYTGEQSLEESTHEWCALDVCEASQDV